ncbi:nucleoside recognition domain-containing protein [Effusibacillus pohliae]|uniref:nucleoside recognition domain-containing protein n=1 Tax=Effusibacillus pohliae TaxID=232270 RepID=UPI00036CEDC6|nr:nucleoside recognition domain-containing protein [Effusibacillus pohliae]
MERGVWRRGLRVGIQTTWVLSKVIVPVTIVVTVLKHTPVIGWIIKLFAPLMNVLGLPGEAAIVLGLGFLLNLYAGIGAMFVLPLGGYQIFVLSVMLSFAHNLLVETAVSKRAGLSATLISLVRVGTAFLFAGVIRLFTPAGSVADAAHTEQVKLDPYLWQMAPSAFLLELLDKAWAAVWQLVLIVIPLMFVIQILKEIQFLDRLAGWMRPVTRALGLPEKAAVPFLAGIFFGLAYGAGVILQATEEVNFTRRELYLMFVFLILCHAVVEDTLLFVPLGVNGWLLLATRLLTAIVITALLAHIWREPSVGPKIAVTNGK